MAQATAQLSNYRQSPRKVRLLVALVKGKRVDRALTDLMFVPKRASAPIAKLIASAAANAKSNHNLSEADLVITDMRVDEGPILYRRHARARGSAFVIRKRTSRLVVVLDDVANAPKKGKKAAKKEKATEATEKKIVAKKAPAKAKKAAPKKVATKKTTKVTK